MISRIMIFIFLACVSHAEGTLPKDSIYQLDSQWTNQDGQNHVLKDFKDKFVVVSMIYLSCQYSCPLTLERMKNMEAKLSEAQRQNTTFLLVSFDPKKDVPKRLKEQMELHHLSASRWIFLTAASDRAPRELAAALGYQYQKTESGDFTHSFQLTLLNKVGIPIGTLTHADQDTDSFLKLISKEKP